MDFCLDLVSRRKMSLDSHTSNKMAQLRFEATTSRARRASRWTVLIFTLLAGLCPGQGQFIAHFNQRGLRGNVTFDVRPSGSGSVLEMEALLESEPRRRPAARTADEPELSKTTVHFDWALHSNSLEAHQLARCAPEQLGQLATESMWLFGASKPIKLDQLNSWTFEFGEKTSRELSSLLWSKSLRLSLAQLHLDGAGIERRPAGGPSATSAGAKPGQQQQQASSGPGPRARPAISKPQLASSSTMGRNATTGPPGKPTFRPRAKPNVLAKFANKPSATFEPPARLVRHRREGETLGEQGAIRVAAEVEKRVKTNQTESGPSLREAHKRIVGAYGSVVLCANVLDVRAVKSVQAVFESPQVAGRIEVRTNEDEVAQISINLYHIRSRASSSRHDWKLMASDILDERREEEKCKYLNLIYDPANLGASQANCSRNSSQCRVGDLGTKHGPIQVAADGRPAARSQLVDLNLPLPELEASRSLFLVLFEEQQQNGADKMFQAQSANILSCAQLVDVGPRQAEAHLSMSGVRGWLRFSQRHASEPTSISYDLFGLEGNVRNLLVRELPLPERKMGAESGKQLCSSLGKTFGGHSLGNLSARHGHLQAVDSDYEDHYAGDWMDLALQLFGPQSVAGHSVSLHKNQGAEVWACATLEPIGEQLFAEARFHFPTVGRIQFSQARGQPHAPTGVLVEVYNPNGAGAPSEGHAWRLHQGPTMGDFYNWSARCQSVGDLFDPLGASTGLRGELYSKQCSLGLLSNEPMRCSLGDLSSKSGRPLELHQLPSNKLRLFYADAHLPLQGPNSILGRSVVIYDELGAPAQRGTRLACATVRQVHPLRASVSTWDSGPGIASQVRGSISFEQHTAAKQTLAKLELSGLKGGVEHYGVHQVWMTDDREFPCSNDSLYDIYNPFETQLGPTLAAAAAAAASNYGPSATADQVRVGDLSRKHGSLEGQPSARQQMSDSSLALFAPNSLIGRSVALRTAGDDFRWVCGNIELDGGAGGARKIVALASFDEPRSRVSGYVRFFQLEHPDGSLSDTFVQVDLRWPRSPGAQAQEAQAPDAQPVAEQSSGEHNWAVFVNQVGEDAFIGADEVRCIAAGFKWNPFLAQDQLEAYQASVCSPAEPAGCAMGDLGLRHGPLRLGPGARRVLSDSNLPLAGNFSVLGRSLVLFDSRKTNVKLACANIMADTHLKSNLVIKRTPSFTVARFIEQMRQLLGTTDWLMVPELRATKWVANGECVQMTIHFYGPRAYQTQMELSNLVTFGSVRKLASSDKISTHYRACQAGESLAEASGAARSG